jgi:Flp pilus assembly CpaE family ATPase
MHVEATPIDGSRRAAAIGGRCVIAVLGGKGGVGASVTAANLAALVAAEGRRPVLVIDLAGHAGDMLALLHADATTTAAGNAPEDAALLASLRVGVAGVRVMDGVRVDRSSATTATRDVRTLCNALRVLFDVIIADVSREPRAETTAVLSEADAVLVVSGMSSLAARATRVLLDRLAGENMLKRSPLLVLNRHEAGSEMQRADVEAVAGMRASVQLPYDPVIVGDSVESGAPFALHHSDAQVTRRLRELGAALGIVTADDAGDNGDAAGAEIETIGRVQRRAQRWRRRLGPLSRRS